MGDYLLFDFLKKGDLPRSENDLLDGFLEYVTTKGLSLYSAQEEAILALYEGQNVILNTPTGSGKSLVALALHFHAVATHRHSYYTCPIKALVNEKFLALCQEFGPAQVGMITGDASVNTGAPIICCTAEILANLCLREGKGAKVDDVIMDEFHYYSDRDRGVAWQIPLLALPQARFMLMSATLGDVSLFASGLTALTSKPTLIVKSNERPVPLKTIYQETPLHETVQGLVSTGKAPVYMVAFTQRECAEEAQNLLSVDLCSKEEKQKISATVLEIGTRFSSPYGKEIQKLVKHGVGIHHAGLLPKYRHLMERLAQKGLLKVICGTDTLGVGVNIPIRSVLFTKLCKYDGEKTTLLTVRDFRQIGGRAGRKGFDIEGLVVVQAPEHVIENMRLESKAQGDAKRLRKLVRKKPPERGFVLWTKETFEKMLVAEAEPLTSQFKVSHGMLLNVLSRPGDGCKDMRNLINSCHDQAGAKERHRRLAFQMFRSLVDRKIIQFTPPPLGTGRHGLKVNIDLQQNFSIHHTLALYLLDTIKYADPYSENYALDIVTLAEAIVEDPDLILRKQLDKVKQAKLIQLKAEGMEFEERIAELDKLEYPKPNREFIYETFNEFAAAHPWIGEENIRPKSIVREMFEMYMTFGEYVREYELQRSEGLLLRYLSEIYKVLVQTVPATAKDGQMEEIIDYLGVMVRQVDSTLLDEWEKLKNPGDPILLSGMAEDNRQEEFDVTRNPKTFTVAIRNEVFQYVKALARGYLQAIVETLRDVEPQHTWTVEALQSKISEYQGDHQGPLTDRQARDPKHLTITADEDDKNQRIVEQVLVDGEGNNDWHLRFAVDVAASKAMGKAALRLLTFDPV